MFDFDPVSASTGVNLLKAKTSNSDINRVIMKFEIRNDMKSTTVNLCGWEMRMYYLIFLIFS